MVFVRIKQFFLFRILIGIADDKVLYDFINGKAAFSKQVTRIVSKFILTLVIVFVCNISFYTSFWALLFIA